MKMMKCVFIVNDPYKHDLLNHTFKMFAFPSPIFFPPKFCTMVTQKSFAKGTKGFFGEKKHKSQHILRGKKSPYFDNEYLEVTKTKKISQIYTIWAHFYTTMVVISFKFWLTHHFIVDIGVILKQ